MAEGTREPSRNDKPELLPQPHGPFVGGDDEIELHGGEATRTRLIERMCAHGAGDAAAERVRRNDITAVGDVLPATPVVGAQIIRADDGALIVGDENAMAERMPLGECIAPRNIAWHRVGFARAKSWLQNAPDRVAIARFGWSDQHYGRRSTCGGL